MFRFSLLSVWLFAVAPSVAQEPPLNVDAAQKAATKALQLVQQSQATWYKKQFCTACHHQILPTLALAMADDRGIAFDAKQESAIIGKTYGFMKDFDMVYQGVNYIDDFDNAWRLLSNHASGLPVTISTTAEAHYLAAAQHKDGSWQTFDSRPPQSYSRVTLTAISARAISLDLPANFASTKETILKNARTWLTNVQPKDTEELVFQLLGLAWTGAEAAVQQRVTKALLATQQRDGGWAQNAQLKSDAYATGQALYALQQTGTDPTNEAILRGVRFLLETQQKDGSWKVDGRLHPPAPVSPPYVSAEFPHGRTNQYTSIAGTTWGAMGLMATLPVQPVDKKAARPMPDLTPDVKDEWVNVVLNGTVADLKEALAKGLKPNAKTAKGTTALMLAAWQPEKVKLLLEAGADATVRAESGFDALMLAARKHGNADVLKLLLKHGAKPTPPKDTKVGNNAAAIFFAVATGDVDMVRVLLDAGAVVNHKMILLGQIPMNTLEAATLRDDPAMLELLLAKGADVNQTNDAKMTLLAWAAIGGHPDVVKLLLAKGAKVNTVDELGMTPLLYAASVDFGHTRVLEQLLAAGADAKAKDERGRTALDLAKLYQHATFEKLLAK